MDIHAYRHDEVTRKWKYIWKLNDKASICIHTAVMFRSMTPGCAFFPISCNKAFTCNANYIDLQCIRVTYDFQQMKYNSPIIWELIILATDTMTYSLPTDHPVQGQLQWNKYFNKLSYLDLLVLESLCFSMKYQDCSLGILCYFCPFRKITGILGFFFPTDFCYYYCYYYYYYYQQFTI